MSFRLFVLQSQAIAVQKELLGKSLEEKIHWLNVRGKITENPHRPGNRPQVYWFESREGIQQLFFFDGDQIVFIGDHHTYTVEPEQQD